MSAKLDRILDAAYLCFTRHGVRRTTMEDIARAAGVSRAAVYLQVRDKADAYRLLAQRLFDHALTRARAEPRAPLARRLAAVLAVKLELTLQLWNDSPHAAELLAETAAVADLAASFTDELTTIVTKVINDAAATGEISLGPLRADEVAAIAMALVIGLETDHTDPELPVRRLHQGATLLAAGLTPQESA